MEPGSGLDVQFFKKTLGIIKLVQLVAALISCFIFICFTCNGIYVLTFAIESIISGVFVLLYLTKLNQKIKIFFWPVIDFFNSMCAVPFLVYASVYSIYTYNDINIIAASMFGLVAAVAASVNSVILFRTFELSF
ncbi:hypothetical protein FKM82_003603 [Ascaphus truei]|uniref:chemokine-like factor n=1 Tax=Ascaphus truei TaxID=8439 RepID=UPI003F59D60C